MGTPITFERGKPIVAAKNLSGLGIVKITWVNGYCSEARPFEAVGRVVGHLVSGEGRDCFLFQQKNPADGRLVMRAIDVFQVSKIETAKLSDVRVG